MFKKNTPRLYGESYELDVIVCPVNMTSPAGAAEQLAGSTPVLWFLQTFLKEKHKQRCLKLKESSVLNRKSRVCVRCLVCVCVCKQLCGKSLTHMSEKTIHLAPLSQKKRMIGPEMKRKTSIHFSNEVPTTVKVNSQRLFSRRISDADSTCYDVRTMSVAHATICSISSCTSNWSTLKADRMYHPSVDIDTRSSVAAIRGAVV